MTTLEVGSVLADRYELLEPLEGDEVAARYRAVDRRLQREVVVEVERPGAARVPTAVGVRTLSGADDTGMLEVLDGGDAGGQHFVVRDLPRGSFDETGVLHTGPTTAVLPAAAAPLVLPDAVPDLDPSPLPARRWAGRRLGWAVAAAVAAVLLALTLAWAGDGLDGPLDTTTTLRVVDGAVDTSAPTKATQPEASTTTEAPTTTVTEVVSDPQETDQLPDGFPFEETGPPGKEKKDAAATP